MFQTIWKDDVMNINIKPAYDNASDIKELFMEYTDMLVENDPAVANYLQVQNYDSELEHLHVKYGLPEGRLYLAEIGDEAAGCIALRRIDEEIGEIKRLYVRPSFRGNKIAHKLIERILQDAKCIGYKSVLLDTLPFLNEAIHLYKKYGFYEIKSYNDSPMTTAIYMKLDLE